MILSIGTIGGLLKATAEPDGWHLRIVSGVSGSLGRRADWPEAVLETPEGATAALQAEVLLDLGIAETSEAALVVPWDRFAEVLREDISLPVRWTVFSPLMLAIDRVSDLGRPDFEYRYSYVLGARETAVDRVGYFVLRRATDQLYHLDEQTYALVDAMDRFNQTPPVQRTREAAWLTFATVKGCSAAVGAALDQHLATNDVVVPPQLALDVYAHEDGSISFVPKVPGLPPGEFQRAFLRSSEVRGVYDLDGSDGRRVRVVLTDRQQQVLERMRRVRRYRGKQRQDAERNPAQFLDGLLDAVEIEYGPRVIGIGDHRFTAIPANPMEGGGFLDAAPETPPDQPNRPEPPAKGDRATSVLISGPGGGEDIRLVFRNRSELEEARAQIAEALARGLPVIELKGTPIRPTQDLLDTLEAPPIQDRAPKDAATRKYLLVYTDERELHPSDLEIAQRAAQTPSALPGGPKLPASLLPNIELKAHQLESVAWLQRCSAIAGRRGVLLADDMGLGKTLQILTYLAWWIEQGRLKVDPLGEDGPPWRPILIIAPLILVENDTWINEMRQFFKDDGDIFQPVLVLRGRGLGAVRSADAAGAETVIGRPVLDAEKLMQYRVVITNYETVVNYQHSLAQLYQGRSIWSAIVTDEAQKYKTPNTKVSFALKAIANDFHVAATGTPVETRLLDLWNIMDTLQPALLGTAQEFSATFERPLREEDASPVLNELRNRLLFKRAHAFLVRRGKDEVLDLPRKEEKRLECTMSDAERDAHAELLAVLGEERHAGRHLSVLQRLTRLYQHYALLRGDWEATSSSDLIRESAKLQVVITELHRIRAHGEKVIIFARHLDAQQLLARTLGDEFGILVPIINGTTSRGAARETSTAGTARSRTERKRILDEFRAAPGFGVIVLSPFVAGIGLTITEANHVIHYGRWWNPAVESQATDRAYRIGQTKPVTVYLPILRDPSGRVKDSFDECLDRLLKRRYDLARDFLHPREEEEANARELCEMLEGSVIAGGLRPLTAEDVLRLTPHDFEALVAALFHAEGYQVILTPKASDGGADVLAFRGHTSLLIQAKHSASSHPVNEDALNDVLAACDLFANRVGRAWKALVVSNASFTSRAIREAERLGIELLYGKRLTARIAERGIGLGAVAAAEAQRARTLGDVIRRARDIASHAA